MQLRNGAPSQRCAGRGCSASVVSQRQIRFPACSAIKVAESPAPTTAASASDTPATTSGSSGKQRATFKASKVGRQPIVEAQRPLSEYMALPASQYSVLDARRIERVDDTTFKCYVGELKFFSWSVEPVITVSVTVEEGGCTIRLLGCKLQGSSFVEDINNKFSATMTNVVRYRDYVPEPSSDSESESDGEEGEAGKQPAAARKEIVSDTTIQVCLEVPAWSSFLPVDSISSAGSGVMQNVLNVMVPRFLAQLRTDYVLWAAGDESRKPVGEI